MPNKGHIHIKQKGIRDFLLNVAWAWRAKYPKRAAAYKRVLAEHKKGLVNPSGMSKEGNLRFTGVIPQDVFIIVERKYPSFFKNHENMRIFQEIFMGTHRPEKPMQKCFFQGV